MRKLALALAAVIVAPAMASAQTATGSVNVNATVQSAVSFGAPTAADFGVVTPNVAATIVPGAAGSGQIPLSYNQDVSVTAPTSVTLNHSTVAASIVVTVACAQDVNPAAATPATFVCNTGHALSGVTTAGTHYYFVGGTIPAAQTASAPAGSYSGSLTFTASFTAF